MTFPDFLSPQAIADLQISEAQSDKLQKRTPEQIEAIYSYGNNILVSASAGSGKTFVMVERIIDKIKRGVAINELFISTFTVKAAGELRERLEKKLSAALQASTNQEEKVHLAQQLADLPNADIGTMDAFSQKLVNQHGYLLGLAPNFRIMQDASEQALFKNDVFADLFQSYMTGSQAASFKLLVRNFSKQSKTSRPFQALVENIYYFIQSTSSPKNWLDQHFLLAHETYDDLSSLPRTSLDLLLREMLTVADQLEDLTESEDYKKHTAKGQETASYKKHKLIFEGLRAEASNQSLQMSDLAQLAERVSVLLPAGDSLTVAKVKYPIFKNLQAQLVGLRHLDTILAYQDQALPLLELLRAFVWDFASQYLDKKKAENAYEFADIGHFAIEILESFPTVAVAYQQRYHEVMVDEYQDNNHTQERLLDLLSAGHNRFMVGDIKQSIYRFRQADPQIFNHKFQLYQADPGQGKLILLKENFRSQSEVLDVTNNIFSRLMDQDIGDVNYDQTHSLRAGSPGQKETQPENQAQFLIYNTDQLDLPEADQAEFLIGEVELVVKEIIRLHNQEKVAFDDITLLVASRTRNQAILQTFQKHGIPLVSDDGEQNYLQSVEVMVMLDTLRTINNPLNDYALVALLKSPMFQWTEDDLARISLQKSADKSRQQFYDKLLLALDKSAPAADLIDADLQQKLRTFREFLETWRAFAKTNSLYDLVWRIYNDRFYYDYVGALSNGQQRQANLYALALRANNFEKTGFKGLLRFIGMIDKILDNQNDLADVEVALPKNAVRLMTIHKSKGLEFKYVFLLNMDKRFDARDSQDSYILSREQGIGIQYLADMKAEFADKTQLPQVLVRMDTLPYQINQRQLKLASLSERMRLLYVAMTRAEKRLYLVGKGSQEKLADKFAKESQNGRLPLTVREQLTSFQDWILAIEAAFPHADLGLQTIFVNDEDLTADKIGQLQAQAILDVDNLEDQRQSETISQALASLEKVTKLNQAYQAAINLPTVRTPSQLKRPKLFDSDSQSVLLLSEDRSFDKSHLDFSLPEFGKKKTISATDLGTAVHELMQRLDLSQPVTDEAVRGILKQLPVDSLVKEQVDIGKVLAFFETDLGQLLQSHWDKVQREAPFALLQKDQLSGEDFVIRGIIDGFLDLEDRIILFDYKTDRYSNPVQLEQRYQQQMALYAQALRQAYGIEQVEQYLILFGGDDLQVVKLKAD